MILKEKVPFIRGMLIYLGMGVMMFATYLQMIQKKKKSKYARMLMIGGLRMLID